ncbi:MAG: hypothetical protein IGBAC_1953 [Ignavibacteriae bacterium]|nr:MAG: hypothetical protein IGBAC_1953 [Ignavibacteriota bacterium]
MKILALISLIIFSFTKSDSQELICKVTMNTDNLTAEARDNILGFDKVIQDYINNYRWTKDDFGDEKIVCSFDIFFKGSPRENNYIAQVFIGSQRKIYRSDKSTGMIRIFDDKWEFSYVRNQPMYHNNPQFDAVTSFLDFYVYIILGFDYDSYKLYDGSDFFQKAFEIASKARSGGGSSEWEAKLSGLYNRVQFIEEIVNPKFKPVREAVYTYHYKGLDLLSKNKSKALENILKSIDIIGNFQKKINERSIFIKTFFDTKYLELCDLFVDLNDVEVYKKLMIYDPNHQKNYDECSKRIK